MYLVSSYWNSMRISDMRIVETPKEILEVLRELYKVEHGWKPHKTFDDYFNENLYYRVYEFKGFGKSSKPKTVSLKKLKELIDNA